MSLFPDSKVYHLYNGAFDHLPIILKTTTTRIRTVPFKFEPMWMTDPSFIHVLNATWVHHKTYFMCISDFHKAIKDWHRRHFGNIFYKKSIILKRLYGIQVFLEKKTQPFPFYSSTRTLL